MLWKTIAPPKEHRNCRSECAYPQCYPNRRENRQWVTGCCRELHPSVRKIKTKLHDDVPVLRANDQRNVRHQRGCCSGSYSENRKRVTPPPFHGAYQKSAAARGEHKKRILV